MTDTLYDLMSTQRAIRKLRPDAIPNDVLQRLFQAAAWAPTGGNTQPWRMIAVRDAAKKKRLGELYAAEWAKFAKGYAKRGEGLPENEQAKMRRTVAAGDYLGEHLFEAPIVVIVCFEPAMLAITDIKQDRPSVVGGGSIYTAVQNLLLACRAEGVGAVLTTLLCQVEPEVKSLLDIPDNFATAAMVPIGYPVGKGYGPTARKEIAELFFADSWGDKFNS